MMLTTRRSLFLILVLPLLLGTGCGTTTTAVLVKISGGERIRVELGRTGPLHNKVDGMEVQFVGIVTHPAPIPPDFTFKISSVKPRALQKIVVEDISDERPRLFVTDEYPKFSDGIWTYVIVGIEARDPRIEWVHTLNNELRIYRFTIFYADGGSTILDQAITYPSQLKATLRTAFGEK